MLQCLFYFVSLLLIKGNTSPQQNRNIDYHPEDEDRAKYVDTCWTSKRRIQMLDVWWRPGYTGTHIHRVRVNKRRNRMGKG